VPDIFINYRTADARFGAAATYELLAARFGRHRVFLDNQSIPAGMPYAAELAHALEVMRVLLVFIGPTWLGDDNVTPGRSMLHCPGDWVRQEIRRALQRQVPIIPVLLDGTSLPDERLLPPDVQPLVRHQAMEVRHDLLGTDVGRLGDRLAALIPVQPGATTPPHQLPTQLSAFVGRTAEIADLTGRLSEEDGDTPGVVVLCGTPGVGKTTLATTWAHRVRHLFPDGQLHVNMRGFDRRGALSPAEALHGFLTGLGTAPEVIPDNVDDRAALYRSIVAGRRILVLVDNVHSADQVRPLLPGTSSCFVLVTSRTQLPSLAVREGARHVPLDVLTDSEAHLLLSKRIGSDRVLAEPAVADEIVARCAGLPLALSIVAALTDQRPGPLARVVQELGQERTRLDELSLGDDDLDLRSVFSWSYQRLSPSARSLFHLIGIHPGPDISHESCLALACTGDARHAIAELARSSLLVEHVAGRYSLHDLLRIYAAERAEFDTDAGQRQSIRHAVADHYLRHVTAAAHWLDPNTAKIRSDPGEAPEFANYPDALAWAVGEHAVVLAVIEFCAQHGLDSHVWRIASRSNAVLRRTGRRRERAAVHRAALAAAAHAGDRLAWATAAYELASALARLGEHVEARSHLDAALPVLQSADDRFGMLQAHLSYTRVLDAQQQHADALQHARTAFELADAQDEPVCRADALIHLGHQQAMLGRHEEALAVCTEALQHYEDLGHEEGQSNCLLTIGMIHQELRDYRAAIEHYERSYTLDRRLGDRYWEAMSLDRLGDVHSLLGHADAAVRSWRAALAIFDSLHHPEADRVRSALQAIHRQGDVSGSTGADPGPGTADRRVRRDR
jgi:tetratricopeptide (TPR) repeat protein